MGKEMYRQGDILIVRVEKPAVELRKVPKDNDRTIVAYGEVTGHCHEVNSDTAELMESEDGRRFLRLVEPSALVHDEHATIDLGVGYFEVKRQREYTPKKSVYVRD